ncbi:YIP1 family protein [Paracoccus sediminicola]|uniref:YIP1 family protein n=1 Tax=Paracoccus sediminicola TaxID=3017783 RepID=UPI0022EFE1CC|nr:YIP1 family protein [Paracoccus sediminicola]WBU55821.1 YIP1 family protein [Paracoccus sediminicola]
MTRQDLVTLARNTLQQPDLALRQLQSLDLPMPVRWTGVLLVGALSSLISALMAQMFPPTGADAGISYLTQRPLLFAGIQVFGMVVTAWLVATVGRAFGGRGDFPDSLLVVTWIDFLLVLMHAMQVVVLLVSPLLASALALAIIVVMVWMTVQMVKALHGFQSAAMVFIGVIGTGLMATIFLSVLANILGLLPEIPVEVSQ